MRGPPVVLTNTLGRPVTNVISERGAVPMTVVNTLGEPVTLVASGGEPVTLFNANGTLWDYPFSLFANNEQGAWYDPSDFSTLFQNAAGTTPVTAVEQPVRLMLDRSGRGNHATAPNDASRPVLRARYNLLTFSEQFDNAAWGKPTGAFTANASTAPNGTLTADRYTPNVSATLNDNIFQSGIAVNNGATYTYSGYIKYVAGADSPWIEVTTVNPTYRTWINIQTRALGTVNHPTAAVTLLSDGWLRFSVSTTVNSTSTQVYVSVRPGDNNAGTINSTGAPAYDIWGAQLLTAADQTSTGNAYQRIAAATDYDTSNPVWRPYLAFDGSDDGFSTSTIDFSGTDEMTVFAGVHKASDAAIATVCMLSASASDGYFVLQAPSVNGSPRFQFFARGTAETTALVNNAIYAAPNTRVVTTTADISAPQVAMRIDGASVNTSTATMGTGNFANAALFIGRRNNTDQPLNGRLYSLAVLGRTATAAEISAMEAWVNGKTGAF